MVNHDILNHSKSSKVIQPLRRNGCHRDEIYSNICRIFKKSIVNLLIKYVLKTYHKESLFGGIMLLLLLLSK